MNDSIPRDFAPTGVLRIGLNLGNPVVVQSDPSGGAPRGVGPDLGRELARRLGLEVAYVPYETAAALADAAKRDEWDLAFLARDPARAGEIDFSAPYMLIEGTYMVASDSPLKDVGDIDRAGVRIAVGDKTAYDLWLTRNIRQATLVKTPSSKAAIEAFRDQGLEAVAGVRQPLAAAAKGDARYRVMEGSFMAIGQASGVPKGREAAYKYLHGFIEEAKGSGFVAKALAGSGQSATVAPPENLI
jgi:polar amino acid transport system substrate-binding protein